MIESELAERVVLARYMQMLSNDRCRKLVGRAVDITTRSCCASRREMVFR